MLRIDAFKKARAKKQSGFVITGELLLIAVVLVIGLVTGFTKLRDQTIAELGDTADAIGAINQSYGVVGTFWVSGTNEVAGASGFAFQDTPDNGLQGGAVGNEVGGDGYYITYMSGVTSSISGNDFGENCGGTNQGLNPTNACGS